MSSALFTNTIAYSRVLTVLSHLLRKGSEHAKASGVSEEEMLGWRLADDMFDLRQQAVSIIYFGQQWLARAVDLPLPPALEGEPTVAGLLAGAAEAKAFIDALKPEQFEGRDDVPLTVELGTITPTFTVAQWIPGFATPNVYFHLSMAYAILRHKGVPLNKTDFFAGGI